MFSLFLGVIGGIGLVVTRTTENARVRLYFIYNFFGTLNLCTGICGLILATIGDAGDYGILLVLVILSFLLGILIYKDIYTKEKIHPH